MAAIVDESGVTKASLGQIFDLWGADHATTIVMTQALTRITEAFGPDEPELMAAAERVKNYMSEGIPTVVCGIAEAFTEDESEARELVDQFNKHAKDWQ